MASSTRSGRWQIIGMAFATLIVGGVFFYRENVRDFFRQKMAQSERVEQIQKDFALLENENAKGAVRAAALLRLSMQGHETAFQKAESWYQSDNLPFKRMAVSAIAYAPFERAEKILASAIESEDLRLRLAAYKALERLKDPEAQKLLKSKSKEPISNYVEWLSLQSSLFLALTDETDRQKQMKLILKDLDQRKGLELTQGLQVMVSTAPQSEELKVFCRSKLDENLSPESQRQLILFLGRHRDRKLAESLSRFVKSDQEIVRSASIEVLPSICPENRWQIFDEFISVEKNNNVLAATITVPRKMGGELAVKAIDSMLNNFKYSDEDKKRLKLEKNKVQEDLQSQCRQMVVR